MAVLSILINHSWKIRLGAVATFTVLFAGVIGQLTHARRSEVFTSSAVYAVVLVVYMSGGLGATGRSVRNCAWAEMISDITRSHTVQHLKLRIIACK
jgi:hypothetical protein